MSIKVSVIVAVYNGAKTLSQCLDSLMAIDFPPEELEILVVDNNSTDTTKEIIGRYKVTYIFEQNRGRGWARNRGVKEARGEFVAFTDADCIATKDWLKNLLEGFAKNDNIAVCGGKIVAYAQETVFERYVEARGILSQERGVRGENPDDLPRVVTANAAFRRSVITEAGYFDEDLLTSEDTELSWRISLLGYEIYYVPGAIVYHQHTRTFRSFCKHHFDFGRAAVTINRKYGRMYLGVGGGPSAAGAILLIARLTGVFLARFFRNLFRSAYRDKPIYIIFDMIMHISYNLGYFYALLQANTSGKDRNPQSKLPLNRFFKSLHIRHNGVMLSFEEAATWFYNDEIVRLVVFNRGLHVYRLNKTATRIWQSFTKTRDFEETLEDMSGLYDVPSEIIRQDADEFVAMLTKESILKEIPLS